MSVTQVFDEKKTEQDILAYLEACAIDPKLVVKLLLLGNSGAGKSLLSAILANADVFKHAVQPEGCTTSIERYLVIPEADSHLPPLLIYNLPGLLELKPALVARNKMYISLALRELPNCGLAGVFVLGGRDDGRLEGKCVSALKALLDFCGVGPEQIPDFFRFVMNEVPEFDADDGDESETGWLRKKVQHEVTTSALLAEQLKTQPLNTNVMVVHTLPRSGKRLGSPQRDETRHALINHILPLLLEAKPMLKIDPSKTIELEEDKWKAEVERFNAEYKETVKKLQATHAADQERFSNQIDHPVAQQSELQNQVEPDKTIFVFADGSNHEGGFKDDKSCGRETKTHLGVDKVSSRYCRHGDGIQREGEGNSSADNDATTAGSEAEVHDDNRSS